LIKAQPQSLTPCWSSNTILLVLTGLREATGVG